MRVIFAGTPEVAVPSLHAIMAAGHDLVGVVTQPDAPGKRGTSPVPSPVKIAALEAGLPTVTPVSASAPDFVEELSAWNADVAAVVAYGQLLRGDVRDAVRLGWVNLHFSLLPQWRGAAPVQRAIMAGDQMTGATTFVIDHGMDTGPILGRMTERIRPTDTAGDLLTRLAAAGAPLLVRSLEGYADGSVQPVEQGATDVSHAAKLTKADAMIDWQAPDFVVERRIRGCTPNPGAWTTLPRGDMARIDPVRLTHLPTTVPGQIAMVDGEVVVGTGTAPVALTSLTPAGKKLMAAVDWWRGARLAQGAQLGDA